MNEELKMKITKPLSHLDNDKNELREIITWHCATEKQAEQILAVVDQYTQSKLKAFAGEVEQLVKDNKELVKVYKTERQVKAEVLKALKAIKERWNI